MEARIARLEAHVEHVGQRLDSMDQRMGRMETDIRDIRRDQRQDFRILFGALIAVALGLAGLMAKGFGWLP